MTTHEHVFGPFELSHFAGTPHRKCTVEGCTFVSLDADENDDITHFIVRTPDGVDLGKSPFRFGDEWGPFTDSERVEIDATAKAPYVWNTYQGETLIVRHGVEV